MVALARKSLCHDWRRYLPVVVAIAMAGVLLFTQAALVLGIFATAGVFVRASAADLWVGYPRTPSVDMGRPVPAAAEMRLRMDPDVTQVDALHWMESYWQARGAGSRVAVVVAGIDPAPDGLLLAHAVPATRRAQLLEPGAILVDPADLPKLGIAVGQYGLLQGHRVRLVGLAPGVRGLGAVTVVASADTARWLGAAGAWRPSATYYLARLRDGAMPQHVLRRLRKDASSDRYEVWLAAEFARRTTAFWFFDTGAGLGFIAAALLVFVVGTVIAAQALAGAVAGSVREFAMLRAMGVSSRELAAMLLAQSSWLGGTGLLVAALIGAAVVGLARWARVPVAPSAQLLVCCAGGVLAVAWVAALACLPRITRTDPSLLLRA